MHMLAFKSNQYFRLVERLDYPTFVYIFALFIY